MMRLLLDENISPALVRLLADIGVYSQSVPHVGLAGRPDHVVWQYALDHDFAVVTTDARDFIELLDETTTCSSRINRVARKWTDQPGTVGMAQASCRACEKLGRCRLPAEQAH